MANEYEDRKRLTFEQAEGAEPLPSQLRVKELSRELRAILWAVIYTSMQRDHDTWYEIGFNKYVYRDHRPADYYEAYCLQGRDVEIKNALFQGTYLDVFGLLQWILRDPNCPTTLADQIEEALQRSRAAYAIFDGDTIIPIGSEAERETLSRAFADLATSEFHGARAHLRNAGSALTAGDYPGSVRESINAVESVARVLEPSARNLAPALAKLEKSVRIHHNLQAGLASFTTSPATRKASGTRYSTNRGRRSMRQMRSICSVPAPLSYRI